MNIHRSSLSGGTPEWLARATARRQLKFVQYKHTFFRDSCVLLKSQENACREWGGKRSCERERERDKEDEVVRIGKANMARNGGGGC